MNTNIADGGDNGFDIGDPCFRLSGWQGGQMMVAYEPKSQIDMNWIADTQFVFYADEANAFRGVANDDPVHPHWLWSAREHVFRSMNQGRNPIMTKQQHREHCNVWYGDADVDDNGIYEPTKDICDDWKPLGDPGPNGRLSSAGVRRDEGRRLHRRRRAGDGRQDDLGGDAARPRLRLEERQQPRPQAVVFDRIDDDATATNSPARFVSAIAIDPNDSNHAWVVYSGFNAKDPAHPGHVFEVRYVPGASTFRVLDGDQPATGWATSRPRR